MELVRMLYTAPLVMSRSSLGTARGREWFSSPTVSTDSTVVNGDTTTKLCRPISF